MMVVGESKKKPWKTLGNHGPGKKGAEDGGGRLNSRRLGRTGSTLKRGLFKKEDSFKRNQRDNSKKGNQAPFGRGDSKMGGGSSSGRSSKKKKERLGTWSRLGSGHKRIRGDLQNSAKPVSVAVGQGKTQGTSCRFIGPCVQKRAQTVQGGKPTLVKNGARGKTPN